ncbi:unnamed protein product, partial [Closterium sp. NIES-53]
SRRPAGRRVALLPARRIAACASPCRARAKPPYCPHRPAARRPAAARPAGRRPTARAPPCWQPHRCSHRPTRAALLLPTLLCAALLAAALPCPGCTPLFPSRAPPLLAMRVSIVLAHRPACGRPIQLDTWLDDLQLYLLSDSRDRVSLFDHRSGASLAPPTTDDSAIRSQWLTRNAAARLAVRNHLSLAERAHFGQTRLLRPFRLQLREQFHQDLPVLRHHSDRGGEFSSDLLRNFCRGEGILQSFTLPDSPQQNGIAERRIGLVMEIARTSMIHAAAPHFLWPFAVRYAAHQLNLWPRVSFPETSPTLRWTGKVGDASVFQFYHSTSRCVLPSQDVTFDKSVTFYHLFPYRTAPLRTPPPLFLASGPPPVDPLPPQGPAPSEVSQVDPLTGTVPVKVAVDSGAARGAVSGGASSWGTASGDAEPTSSEPGGDEPEGAEPGGAESEGAESGGAELGGAESRGC